MIIINLLPEELRPIKRTPLPHILSLVVLAVVVVGSVFLLLQSLRHTSELKSKIAQAEKELDGLKHIVDEYNQLGQRKLDLQDKVATIEEILRDRKIWSQHLHRLAQLTPENFWYSGIKETKETFRENKIKYDDKTHEPVKDKNGEVQMEVVTVQKPVLEIRGYIINDEEGHANLNSLLTATTDDKEFSANFDLFRPSIEDTDFKGFNVRAFTAEFEIKSGAPKE